MPTIVTADGTQIFYKDWAEGQPIFPDHGAGTAPLASPQSALRLTHRAGGVVSQTSTRPASRRTAGVHVLRHDELTRQFPG